MDRAEGSPVSLLCPDHKGHSSERGRAVSLPSLSLAALEQEAGFDYRRPGQSLRVANASLPSAWDWNEGLMQTYMRTYPALTGYILTNIQWDREVDGKIVDIDLPNTMTVDAESEDDAVDVASDETGFCIYNATVRRAEETE